MSPGEKAAPQQYGRAAIPLNLGWARRIIGELRSGHEVSNHRFDKLFSPAARQLSRRQWTPLAAARRAAELLTDGAPRHILDVGSGVGKFCLIGAITTPGHFFGIEEREWLAKEAQTLSQVLALPHLHFSHGNMASVDWEKFDGFYFYNPFYEDVECGLTINVEASAREEEFRAHIAWVSDRLAGARIGTRVVTFHGFGGSMPIGYELVVREPIEDDSLELWVKKKPGALLHLGKETSLQDENELPFTD